MKKIDRKHFFQLLHANGYKVIRNSGGHRIWSNGKRTLSINAVNPNRMVMQRLIKEYGLMQEVK